MKRPVSTFSFFLVLSLLPLVPASAAVKAGATCTKLNQTSVTANIRYTCIRSGAKLVWNKGMKIATTSNTSNAVDQVKAKIELEKVDINREMIFRLSNKTLQRKANSGNFYTSDSRPITEFDPIRVATFNAVLAHSEAKTHPKISINYEIRDSFPKALADYSVKMIEASANYWNDLIEESATVTVQLFTEKDRDWINSQPMKFGTMDANLDRLAAWDSNNPQMIFFTGGGGYWEAAGVTKGLLSLATSSAAYPERMNFEWATVASHEFTHIIEGYFFRNLKNLPDEQYAAASPANFREGNAIVFGYIVSLQNLGWYSDMLDRNLFDGLNAIKTWMPVKTESNVVALLEATEKFSPNQAQAVAYSIGALFYEWVISQYGFEKFYDIAKGAASTANYSQNIERSFGVPKETLYKLAAPYILKNINRVLNS
jgi:hypothetical protein